MLYLINHQSDIDKVNIYAKDPYEPKYQVLINKHEQTGVKHFKDHGIIERYKIYLSKC